MHDKLTQDVGRGNFVCTGTCGRIFEDTLPPLWVSLWPVCCDEPAFLIDLIESGSAQR